MLSKSPAPVIVLQHRLLRQDSHNCFAGQNSDGESGDLVAATQLVEAAHSARRGDCEAAKALITRALALLRGDPQSPPAGPQPLNRRAPQELRGGLALWQAKRVAAHIDAHLAERIRIEELAALLRFSVGHFCRAFKATFGVSAHTYLTRRRIELAQCLMLTTHEPLGAIALSCGMSDQSHFTRLFRRVVGETPHAWRRSRRGALEDQATDRAYSLPKPGFTDRFQPSPGRLIA